MTDDPPDPFGQSDTHRYCRACGWYFDVDDDTTTGVCPYCEATDTVTAASVPGPQEIASDTDVTDVLDSLR